MGHQVFISHASLDVAQALGICNELEASGVLCWIAPRNVPPDTENWAGEIAKGLLDARLVLLVFSARTNESDQVVRELALAMDGSKRLLFLRLEDAKVGPRLAYYLAGKQRLDALNGSTAHLDLPRRVRGILEGRATTDSIEVVAPTVAPTEWWKKLKARWLVVTSLVLSVTATATILMIVAWVRNSQSLTPEDRSARDQHVSAVAPPPAPPVTAPTEAPTPIPAATTASPTSNETGGASGKGATTAAKPASPQAPPVVIEKPGPATETGIPVKPRSVTLSTAALFETGKSVLLQNGQTPIKDFAASFAGKDYKNVFVLAHSDNVGNPANNVALTNARAQAIRTYLISLGVDPKRIVVQGYGGAEPVADNATAEGRDKNRRVVLSVM